MDAEKLREQVRRLQEVIDTHLRGMGAAKVRDVWRELWNLTHPRRPEPSPAVSAAAARVGAFVAEYRRRIEAGTRMDPEEVYSLAMSDAPLVLTVSDLDALARHGMPADPDLIMLDGRSFPVDTVRTALLGLASDVAAQRGSEVAGG